MSTRYAIIHHGGGNLFVRVAGGRINAYHNESDSLGADDFRASPEAVWERWDDGSLTMDLSDVEQDIGHWDSSDHNAENPRVEWVVR